MILRVSEEGKERKGAEGGESGQCTRCLEISMSYCQPSTIGAIVVLIGI